MKHVTQGTHGRWRALGMLAAAGLIAAGPLAGVPLAGAQPAGGPGVGAQPSGAQPGGARSAGGANIELDVTRVAIFSSGVGYFERAASVQGDGAAELRFRTEQINDILKSLIVQDLGGGRVGVVRYASQDPIEKTLRSFGVDLTGKPTLGELLDQLRGEPIVVSGPQTLEGTIVGVEKVPVLDAEGNVLQQIERLTLLTAAGLQQVELHRVQGVKLVDDEVRGELEQALATLARAHDADKKAVTLNFQGTGRRDVNVAYLLEAPIWKTSYRLALSQEEAPFLQGWATVENATEEDWNNVELTLVSGRPISFRMDLYTPLYVPRPVEQLELYASLRPPEYAGGHLWAEGQELGDEVARKAVTLARRARAAEPPAGAPASDADYLSGERYESLGFDFSAGVASVAVAAEAGELFQYRIATPVTLPRQQSAMLPIVNQAIEGTKLSIYNPATHAKYPLNGLELKNTTGLHLMQGPVTVFDGAVYAGDAKLPDLKPDEQRLIAYALDLAMEVLIDRQPTPTDLLSVRIAKGTLWQRHRQVDARTYQVKNKADKVRTVLIEQGLAGGDWKLTQPEKPYERTEALLRFKLDVPAKETKPLPVRLERVVDESVILSDLGIDRIEFFLRAPNVSQRVKEALQQVVELRQALGDAQRQRERLEGELRDVLEQQARIRENLKTLDRNTDAYQRQLQKFDEFENDIERLRQEIAAARDREEQQRQALESYLLSIEVE